MPEYYTPKTKSELIKWIKKRYWNAGKTAHDLNKMSKKQLYAIFYSILDRIRQKEREVFNEA